MCGIAGAVLDDPQAARAATASMCEQMVPRGPDDGGVDLFSIGGGPIALGSRRLAIIDPSPAGHQPMLDPDRRNVVVFNGMIYNFRELRAELESVGERFTSHCDTEVVLHAYGVWGESCVERLEGMFAFAVLEPARGRLFLARDRLGIKPLYFWHDGDDFAFASQVRALLASGLVPRRLSTRGVASYLATGAVQEPYTVIDGVRALLPGHVAVLDRRGCSMSRYWSPPVEAAESVDRPDAEERLRELLDDSVERHLVSDRPTGLFLSGGVDSSVLCALAGRRHDGVKTISVVFEEQALSEAHFARTVANAVGSDHTEVTLTQADLRAALDGAFAAMDQPTFDGVNTYVVSRAAASTGLKVALSGLGADELFDGYGYVRRVELLDRAARLPRPLALAGAHAAGTVLRGSRGEKARSWLERPREQSPYDLLRRLFAPAEVARLVPSWTPNGDGGAHALPLPDDPFNAVSVLDMTGYMRNVLLRDTDAMSMASSLEVRVPYLHDPLVDWVLRLRGAVKGRSKSLLVSAARDLIPAEAWNRPKQGFLLPIASWLRSDLGGEVAETLASPHGAIGELLDRQAVMREWTRFACGEETWLRPWGLYALSRWAGEVGAA